ncbi:hypothetical protein [Methylobacterium terrae]|uniref:hypothetical protein n=1 Tax=Methylobacterium terrae TaxID=2202827 RepID=UPI001FE0A5B4|nr:hypothetical protein [Methylobacterium terrae]
MKQVAEHWSYFAPLLTKPTTDEAYQRLVEQLDEVLALAGEDEDHSLSLLASRMGDLIEAYDEERRPLPMASGAEVLRAVMQERGLGQSDLPKSGHNRSCPRSWTGSAGSTRVRRERWLFGSAFRLRYSWNCEPPAAVLLPAQPRLCFKVYRGRR